MDHHNQSKPKSKILKLLPKAFTFHHLPFSPGRDTKQTAGRGFSGPMKISIVPVEARTKSKNSSFETQEPSSPKVSCIGQIKNKKKELAKRSGSKISEPAKPAARLLAPKPRPSAIQRLFSGAKLRRMKSEAAAPAAASDREEPPVMSQMKRFSSGRGALANFDWTAQIAPVDREGADYHEEEVIIRVLQPRKEVNLWKRRTMAPPRPLQLNDTV